MPFARHSGYSFTAVSVRQNAPAWGGIYCLSNAQAWIDIHAADDIRAALLDHLNERNPTPDFRSVTGFTFELCDTAERSQRCSRLTEELRSSSEAGRNGRKRETSSVLIREGPWFMTQPAETVELKAETLLA